MTSESDSSDDYFDATDKHDVDVINMMASSTDQEQPDENTSILEDRQKLKEVSHVKEKCSEMMLGERKEQNEQHKEDEGCLAMKEHEQKASQTRRSATEAQESDTSVKIKNFREDNDKMTVVPSPSVNEGEVYILPGQTDQYSLTRWTKSLDLMTSTHQDKPGDNGFLYQGEDELEGTISTLNSNMLQPLQAARSENPHSLHVHFNTTANDEAKETVQLTATPKQIERGHTEKDIEDLTKGMVQTKSVRVVASAIQKGNTWITITGAPGEGKKRTAYLVMKELSKIGKDMYIINTSEKYFEIKRVNNAVFLLKDTLGHELFHEDSLEKWRPVFDDLRERRDSTRGKQNIVIFVQRLNVLNSCDRHLGSNKKLLHEKVINISEIARSEDERQSIWRFHSKEYGVQVNNKTVSKVCKASCLFPYGFPHSCRMFAELFRNVPNLNMESFFMKPVAFLNENIIPFLRDESVKSLFKNMIQYDGKIPLGQVDHKAESAIRDLEGTYFTIIDEKLVQFIHESVYDSVSFILSGMTAEDALFVVQHCRMKFLKDRIRFLKRETDSELVAYLVINGVIQAFLERAVDEILNNKNIEDTLGHPVWMDTRYTEQLILRLTSHNCDALMKCQDLTSGNSFLFFAASNGSANILNYLTNYKKFTTDEQSEIVRGIIAYDAPDALEFLIRQYPHVVNDIYDNQTLEERLIATESSACLDLLHRKALTTGDVTTIYDDGKSILHILCESGGSRDGIRSAIRNGADVNLQCSKYETPLHYACRHGNEGAVIELIDAGAEKNMMSQSSDTPLVCAVSEGQSSIINILMDNGVNCYPRWPGPMLCLACSGGHIKAFKTLLRRVKQQVDWYSLLQCAVTHNQYQMLETILDYAGTAAMRSENILQPPLHVANRNGFSDIVKLLISSGADVNEVDLGGDTLLCAFFENPMEEDVLNIIESGFDVNLVCKSTRHTPLEYACSKGYDNAVELLLAKGADANVTDRSGQTCLYKAMCSPRNRDNNGQLFIRMGPLGNQNRIASLLVANHADVNICDSSSRSSPLHEACFMGNLDMITLCLDAGADVSLKNEDRDTVLHVLCSRCPKNTKVLSLVNHMVLKGADVNSMNRYNQQALHGWFRSKYMKEARANPPSTQL